MLILSILPVVAGQPSGPPPFMRIYVDDSDAHFYSESNITGTQFDVTVDIDNVTWLGSFYFDLLYNTTFLDGIACSLTPISENYLADYVPSPWTSTASIFDDEGRISFGAVFKDPEHPFNGTGAVLTITFEITFEPPYGMVSTPANETVSCALELSTAKVGWVDPVTLDTGPYVLDTDYTVDDGLYEWIRPQKLVGAPTAACSVTPSTAYVGDTVTFDGTASDDGGAPPLTYAWDVNSDGTVDYTTATVVVPCPTAGDFNVTLTVTNDLQLTDTADPQYWTVKEKLGPIIDLYTSTNRWCGVDTEAGMVGKGDDVPCDALSPDVNVTLFAEVTYNGAPVNNVFVAFEVLWEYQIDWYDPDMVKTPGLWVVKNSCVLYATAETNKDGIAQIALRVPTSPDPTEYIGKWLAMANCKVQEVPIEDTMRFDVGYLVIMYDIEVLREVSPGEWQPDTSFVREVDKLGVMVYAKSISWIPRFTKFILVAYDECNVPLGQMIVGFDFPAATGYCSPKDWGVTITGILIPQWAYVGMGRVEVSVLTELPHNGGVPYSKGISAGIEVTWSP